MADILRFLHDLGLDAPLDQPYTIIRSYILRQDAHFVRINHDKVYPPIRATLIKKSKKK